MQPIHYMFLMIDFLFYEYNVGHNAHQGDALHTAHHFGLSEMCSRRNKLQNSIPRSMLNVIPPKDIVLIDAHLLILIFWLAF